MLDHLRTKFKQWLCRHRWRPALRSGVRPPNEAVRYCDRCDKREVISEAEFYAQFGRMPRRLF